MNFRQIEAFRSVMATGSVTGAAQLLAISQPAVSRLISDLEKHTGFPLFQKRGRNLVATEEGSTLYVEVNRAFVGLEDLKAASQAIRNHQTGTLNLVTMPGLASHFVPQILRGFSDRYADIGIWLEVLPRHDVITAIGSGQYDIGLVSGPVNEGDLTSSKLCDLQAYCVLPDSHRLARHKTIAPRMLDGERFISLARDSLFRYSIMTLLDQHGVDCRFDLQARTADAVHGMVAAGLGVSIIGPVLPCDHQGRGIVFRPLSPALKIPIDLVFPDQATRIARLFEDVAHNYSRSLRKRSTVIRKST